MVKHIGDNAQHFLNEDAIISSNEDIFNFKPYAKKIQKLIQNNSSNSNTLTIGIYGKWGEGKTSFMNLIKEQIDGKEGNEKGILIYNFNPWRYSTEDEMLFDFFDGLSKTMMISEDGNLKKAGKRIVKLSSYLKALKISATVGVPGFLGGKIEVRPEKILKKMGQDFQGEDITIEKLAENVNKHLLKSDYKVAVFIDDLDRLDKDEIYTMLKLIKLNAHFKNFVYLLTIDQEQAAKAISQRYGDELTDGYMFLEKIINIPIQLPRIEKKDLFEFFSKKLELISKHSILNNRK
ncbi:MAG: P-loop NTPase fold protein, partial [Leeuwenhoekiella sp.]